MNWEKLKSEGWYILREKGTYQKKDMVAYSVVKNDDEKTKSVICYLNFIAVVQLKRRYNFPVKKSEKQICWLNYHDFMDFNTQTKEPLKITFDK